MKHNKKICTGGCGLEKFIWKNHGGKRYCMQCWLLANPPKKTPKTTTFIKPVSKKRQDALKTYRRRREKYFEKHPVCEFPGCNSTDITLHHKRGRIGSFLTDKRYFCSLCWPHHKWVEEHPEEARKLGLTLSRLVHGTDNE